MKLSGVLIRFAIAYMVLAALVSAATQWMEMKNNGAAEFVVLIGSVLWVSAAFHAKNGRYFTASERTRVVLGMLLIDLAIQSLIFGAWTLIQGARLGGFFLFSLPLVAALHGVVIYFATGWLAFRNRGKSKIEEQHGDAETR